MHLFGASGHCKVVIDVILESKAFRIESIVDHHPKFKTIFDIPVLDFTAVESFEDKHFIVSVGDNQARKNVVEILRANYLTAIHPKAIVSRFSSVAEGSVVMAGSVINAESKIGKHCIINTGAIIEHDCVVGDYVHVSPNASIAGNVALGEGCHIGIGAQIIQGITVGKWVVVGAGAVIINDVPDYAVVVGIPGKIIKFNTRND
ncbi:MAG TPA: acetyltransferase [Flavobacterium sp.]|nr:acetyltransferase [Flavobacterium sp.]